MTATVFLVAGCAGLGGSEGASSATAIGSQCAFEIWDIRFAHNAG